jgi:hypothetical protein
MRLTLHLRGSRLISPLSPILTPPMKKEDMLLYIAATTTMVNVEIIIEREEEGMYSKYSSQSTMSERFY